MRSIFPLLIILILVVSLLAFSSIIAAQKPGSCEEGGTTYCGKKSPDGCFCDTKQFKDHCADIDTVCGNTSQTAPAATSNSCQGKCGVYDAKASCQCDVACEKQSPSDCCSDYGSVCKGGTPTQYPTPKSATPKPSEGSCQGYCGTKSSASCYCDTACTDAGDCCSDYQSACKGGTPPKSTSEYVATFKINVIGWSQTGGFFKGGVIVPTYRFKVTDIAENSATIWAIPAYGDSLLDEDSIAITPIFKTLKIDETVAFKDSSGDTIKITLKSIEQK